jgi:hypothetical protein
LKGKIEDNAADDKKSQEEEKVNQFVNSSKWETVVVAQCKSRW